MKRSGLVAALILAVGCLSAGTAKGAAPDTEGHEFGKWPALNAIIHQDCSSLTTFLLEE